MNDQWGNGESGQEPTSPQSKYYERYMQSDSQATVGASSGGSGNNKKVAMIAGGVAAALLLGIGGFVATRGGDDTTAASSSTTDATTSGSTSGEPSTSSSSTTSSSSSVDRNTVLAERYGPLVNAGWKMNEGKETANAVYEVPDNDKWKPKDKGYLLGWMSDNTEDKSLVTSAPATYDEGFCATDKKQESGFVGFVNIGTRDPAEAAPDVVYKVARLIAYNKDTKQYAKISDTRTRQITVNGGKTQAVESLLVVTNAKVNDKKCDAKNYEARTVAFTGNGVSTMLLIFRQQDGTSKLPDADVNGIINSLRPKK